MSFAVRLTAVLALLSVGASVFVIRPAFLFGETVDDFIAPWQITRDMSRRGVVEVLVEETV